MPHTNQLIPHDSEVLGVYATPGLTRLKSLFLVLFSLIFTASKA
jgi:hypothetical protein